MRQKFEQIRTYFFHFYQIRYAKNDKKTSNLFEITYTCNMFAQHYFRPPFLGRKLQSWKFSRQITLKIIFMYYVLYCWAKIFNVENYNVKIKMAKIYTYTTDIKASICKSTQLNTIRTKISNVEFNRHVFVFKSIRIHSNLIKIMTHELNSVNNFKKIT